MAFAAIDQYGARVLNSLIGIQTIITESNSFADSVCGGFFFIASHVVLAGAVAVGIVVAAKGSTECSFRST